MDHLIKGKTIKAECSSYKRYLLQKFLLSNRLNRTISNLHEGVVVVARGGQVLLLVGGQHPGVHRGVGDGRLAAVHGEPAPQAPSAVVRPARGVLSWVGWRKKLIQFLKKVDIPKSEAKSKNFYIICLKNTLRNQLTKTGIFLFENL